MFSAAFSVNSQSEYYMCAISVRKIFSLVFVVAAYLSVFMSFKINTDYLVDKSSLSYKSWRQLHTIFAKDRNLKNKGPMGHIANIRKQFKSKYDYIITLIRRRKNIIFFLRIAWFLI